MLEITRRQFVSITALAASGLSVPIDAQTQSAYMSREEGKMDTRRIRDHCWLWGHPSGSHNANWNLPKPSRISPCEAAAYMGIPNVIMVRYAGEPLPLDTQYIVPFRALREVVWSVVGASGTWLADETTRVIDLPNQLPNMTGVMMDDFFKPGNDPSDVGTLSPNDLIALRKRLAASGQGLKLWVVLYDHQLDLPVRPHLELCDTVTFWTWEAANLKNLEANFAKMERVVPRSCNRVLGCYMYDYGARQPMPVDAMQHQCELGLKWLREGRVKGMIFLASCICDLELETVEWTRRWIAEVGDGELR